MGVQFPRMGTTGFVAQAFGASDAAEINAIFLRAMVTAVAIGLAVVISSNRWRGSHFMSSRVAQDSKQAHEYYDARIWSAAALVNLVVLGTLFGLQRMRAALVIQLVLNALNIILDLWFVVGLGWGVAGVAWASTFAEYAASVVGLYIVIKALNDLGGPWRSLDLNNQRKMRAIWAGSANIFLRTLSVQVTFFFLRQARARETLSTPVPCCCICSISWHMVWTALHSQSGMTGNAFGARNPRRLRAITIATARWSGHGGRICHCVLSCGAMDGWAHYQRTRRDGIRRSTCRGSWRPQLSLCGVTCSMTCTSVRPIRAKRNSMMLAMAGYFPLVWLTMPWLGNHGLWLAVLTFAPIRANAFCLVPAHRAGRGRYGVDHAFIFTYEPGASSITFRSPSPGSEPQPSATV